MDDGFQIRHRENTIIQGRGMVPFRGIEKRALIMEEEALLIYDTSKTSYQSRQQAYAFYTAELAATTARLQTAVVYFNTKNRKAFNSLYAPVVPAAPGNTTGLALRRTADRFQFNDFNVTNITGSDGRVHLYIFIKCSAPSTIGLCQTKPSTSRITRPINIERGRCDLSQHDLYPEVRRYP
ncbi:hypothetical protein DE146DRAFT_622713 [Phaeosphaeria sp. MPI-PUGE-AT-0046c]|nr:hypothetical protein DE146DRAFT_622713 [Phaeosphaeria sp. MPI-PUGE-AT-0046c]